MGLRRGASNKWFVVLAPIVGTIVGVGSIRLVLWQSGEAEKIERHARSWNLPIEQSRRILGIFEQEVKVALEDPVAVAWVESKKRDKRFGSVAEADALFFSAGYEVSAKGVLRLSDQDLEAFQALRHKLALL